MRVAIVHDRVDSDANPDARDVLIQAEAVRAGLENLGHTVMVLPCDLDLEKVMVDLDRFHTGAVFNLVESIGGHGRLIHLLPFCLDAAGLPYTGARAEAMLATSNKTMAKTILQAAGLFTPDWVGPFPASPGEPPRPAEEPADWIIKSVWEHASIGLDETAIVGKVFPKEAAALLPERAGKLGNACFAEKFIDGREFNLSLLGGKTGPTVLPPAEIHFTGYAPEKPRIVDYRAKWDEASFEFHHTPRCFDFPEEDRPLLERLSKAALGCWELFRLRGYARVDFRVDFQGRPWILEVNANPCLSPDAGFAAALQRAGISFPEAVQRILDDMT
ncbi:MAG: D-alanine--D-alanine ligase family protein [Thermodesulfobacteriota bacterium]